LKKKKKKKKSNCAYFKAQAAKKFRDSSPTDYVQ
jgi:hypothetical protein